MFQLWRTFLIYKQRPLILGLSGDLYNVLMDKTWGLLSSLLQALRQELWIFVSKRPMIISVNINMLTILCKDIFEKSKDYDGYTKALYDVYCEWASWCASCLNVCLERAMASTWEGQSQDIHYHCTIQRTVNECTVRPSYYMVLYNSTSASQVYTTSGYCIFTVPLYCCTIVLLMCLWVSFSLFGIGVK